MKQLQYIGLATACALLPFTASAQNTVDVNDLVVVPAENGGFADDEIFGVRGGYIHPYLSLRTGWTDNVFNVDDDTDSSWLYTISPGVWFSLPRMRVVPITIAPHNTSAGGLQLELDDDVGTDKYQLYALVGSDINMYSYDSDLNSEDYYAEGMARWNMASGLSLRVLDRFTLGHDDFGVGEATDEDLREFDTNLLMLTADWELTEKLRFKVDYSNFLLQYDEADNAFFFDRTDNVIDLYGYYKYSEKTSLFLQYRYTDVEYDNDTAKDNSQDYYYGGVRWVSSDKLALLFKAGLQSKSFDAETDEYQDSDNFTLDLQAHYRMTDKTDMTLDLYQKNEESDNAGASEKLVLGARFVYSQAMTEKITAKLGMGYENSDYEQLVGQADRDEDTFYISPAVQFLVRDWLMAELSYSFETTDSSDDAYDYDTNTIYLSLNFAM
ncbi:outer membrane beta-barrel protein [Desulfosediminicola sp.]|uniref:outer membrane beta-barrel protein n=1 Tax=Desulfosediminicola sp. TaxID=2886825 RepID=UPI003AF20934